MKTILFYFKLYIILLVFLSSCGAPTSTYTPKNYASDSVVAVWDLENYSITSNLTLDNLQEFLSARIAETMAEESDFVIVERQKLVLALEELNIGTSALADKSTRIKVGHMVGAQLMVFGGCQQAGDQLRIDLRLVDVELGTVVRTGKITTTATGTEDLIIAAEKAARKLL